MKINLAIIGAGRIGHVHAEAINKNINANLIYIYDTNNSVANNFASKFNCKIADINSIKNDKNIDAVVICSPTNTHIDLIKNFSRAKKAIFCEKPIDLNIKKVRRCLTIIEKNNINKKRNRIRKKTQQKQDHQNKNNKRRVAAKMFGFYRRQIRG